MHILLIEDDLDLGRSLHKALVGHDFSCEWLRRIGDVPQPLTGYGYDCVLLDLCLPDGGGLDLLTRWRRLGIGLPVIVITAKSTLEDRLSGFNRGADDFLVKPFAMAELIARIHAVLRRYAHQADDCWTVGPLKIEPRGNAAWLDGQPLDLSRREFQLLLELVREPGVVVPKGMLAQRLEPLGDAIDYGAVEVHMHNLRRKIGADRIKTVRGVGYKLAAA